MSPLLLTLTVALGGTPGTLELADLDPRGTIPAARLADALTSTEAWATLDPTSALASRFEAHLWRFGDTQLLRLTPVLVRAGIEARVEGADRIVVLRPGEAARVRVEAPLDPRGAFELSEADAMAVAFTSVPRSLLKPADIPQTRGFARPVWLRRGRTLRPAWRVRVPTLRLQDLRDVWVDAEDGTVLLSQPTARFAPPTAAKVFDPAPAVSGAASADLVDVELSGLAPAEIGGNLKGMHVETFNCCKRYTCPAAATTCPVEDRICADDDDTSAIQSTVDIDLPASSVPLDLSLVGFTGDTVYLRSVFCTEKPRLTSTAGPDGWFPTPIDVPRSTSLNGGLDSETDAFVELQLYWATQTFFEHLRTITENPAFCLRDSSMLCEGDGSATVDVDGQPLRPFHVTGNLLFPEIDTSVSLGNPLLQQFAAGKGDTPDPDDRIFIADYTRFDNAAFIPAQGEVGVPPGLEQIASQFNRPYDSNVYLQGHRDFGYDGDVVFHEFTHAVVWSLVQDLRSAGADRWGTHVEPGAMNEGWADYFSASFTDSSVTAEYSGSALAGGGEGGLRDLNNDNRCPADVIGEVHEDSLPFSASLWEIREAVVAAQGDTGVDLLDQLLLMTMSDADADETMAAQAARVVTALGESPDFDATIVAAAEQAFEAHGIRDCHRVFSLSTVAATGAVSWNTKDVLLLPAPAEAGLSGIAPAPIQFRVDIPPGSPGFALRWEQGSGGLGSMGGSEPATVSVFPNEGEPVDWRYEGAASNRPVPYDGGAVVDFDASNSATHAVLSTNGAGATVANYTLELTPLCQTRSFYANLISTGGAATLFEIKASPATPTLDCPDPAGKPEKGGCAAASSGSLSLLLGGLAIVARLRRRRPTTG